MNLYGVFFKRGHVTRWGTNTNKKWAIKFIKCIGNGEVRVIESAPENASYDAPTFRELSRTIFSIK